MHDMKPHPKLLVSAILALGVLSCDVRDKATAPKSDSFVTLAPRLVRADGGKIDSVDSVRIEVKYGEQTVVRSAPFGAHGVRVDSIPANTPWTLTVKGLRKAADGLHWPVRWQGTHSSDGTGSETVRLDTVLIAPRDTTPPNLSEGGLPVQAPPALPFGRTLDTLQFHFASTDSVYCDSVLHPRQTGAGVSYYSLVFAVPDTFVIKVVDSAKKVSLDTLRFTVSPKPKDTTRADTATTPALATTRTVDTAARKISYKATISSGADLIDSVVFGAGTSLRVALRPPFQDTLRATIQLLPGSTDLMDSVYAKNGRNSSHTDSIVLPLLGKSSPPKVDPIVPARNPDTVGWSQKSVDLAWNVHDSIYSVVFVGLNGNQLRSAINGSTWGGTQALSLGLNSFTLLAKNSNGDTASSELRIVRRDTIHPAVTWKGRYPTGDTVDFRKPAYIANWIVADLDTLTAVTANGKPRNGTQVGPSEVLYSDTIQLRKASLGYDTVLWILATGGEASDTTRNQVAIHVSKDTSHPVFAGADSVLVPYGTSSYKASWSVSDLDTVMSVSAVATANDQPVTNVLVRNGNNWTDSFPLASSPVIVKLTATDSAGNVSTKSFDVRVAAQTGDHTPPTIARSLPVVSVPRKTDTVDWNRKTAIFSWQITDDSALTVKNNGKALHPTTSKIWLDTQYLPVGLDTFILVASDNSANTSADTVVFYRQADATVPSVARSPGTRDTVLPSSIESFTAAWTVTDNALKSVTINGMDASRSSDDWSRSVALFGDSLWIKLVAVDSGDHIVADSIRIRRLKPPVIRPATLLVTPSIGANPTFESNLPGATFEYSTDKSKSTWTTGSDAQVGQSEFLFVRAVVDGIRSDVDSGTYLYPPVMTASGGLPDSSAISISAPGSPVLEYSFTGTDGWQRTTTGSVRLAQSTKVYARSSLGGLTSSIVNGTYALPPKLSPSSGSFAEPFHVVATCTGADRVELALDTANGWASPFDPSTRTISGNTTVFARSILGSVASPTVVATYLFPHDTSLASVTVNGVAVANRDANGDYYTDSLPVRTTDLSITATPNSPNASITILTSTGAGVAVTAVTTLTATSTIIEISVVNGNSTKTFRLKVVRKQAPPNLVDKRNGASYPTTRIGNQIWMAMDLNYAGPVDTLGSCYNDQPINCSTFGRLYTWAEAMNGGTGSASSPSHVQGLCPQGSHLPSSAEWNTLASFLGAKAGMALPIMANSSLWNAGPGTDALGFSALPGGRHDFSASSPYDFEGNYAFWWTSTEGTDPAQATTWRIPGSQRYLQSSDEYKEYSNSIRCIVDP